MWVSWVPFRGRAWVWMWVGSRVWTWPALMRGGNWLLLQLLLLVFFINLLSLSLLLLLLLLLLLVFFFFSSCWYWCIFVVVAVTVSLNNWISKIIHTFSFAFQMSIPERGENFSYKNSTFPSIKVSKQRAMPDTITALLRKGWTLRSITVNKFRVIKALNS